MRWTVPDDRVVMEDALLEHGKAYPPLPPYFDGNGNGNGDGGYGDGNGDGGYGGGDGDGGNGDGYGGNGGYGNGDGYGDGGKKITLRRDALYMRSGLCIVVSPGGYSPYVRIGWCRRVEGDEWEIVGARVIRRFGSKQQLVNLAAKGPVADTELLDAAKDPSPIHRLHAIRVEIANEKAWVKHCPMPKGYHHPAQSVVSGTSGVTFG